MDLDKLFQDTISTIELEAKEKNVRGEITNFLSSVRQKDPLVNNHLIRVANLSYKVSIDFLSFLESKTLFIGGLYHNLGVIELDADICQTPEKYTSLGLEQKLNLIHNAYDLYKDKYPYRSELALRSFYFSKSISPENRPQPPASFFSKFSSSGELFLNIYAKYIAIIDMYDRLMNGTIRSGKLEKTEVQSMLIEQFPSEESTVRNLYRVDLLR